MPNLHSARLLHSGIITDADERAPLLLIFNETALLLASENLLFALIALNKTPLSTQAAQINTKTNANTFARALHKITTVQDRNLG